MNLSSVKRSVISLIAALSVMLAILAIGCQGDEEIRGFYAGGWEWSEFRPCQNLEEQWWVTGDSLFFSKYDSLTAAEGYDRAFGPTVFVIGTGMVSKPGEYGHVGAYNRELEIKQVELLRYREDLREVDYRKMEQICADQQ